MNEVIECLKDPFVALALIVTFASAISLIGMTVQDMLDEWKERRS